jgi:hypothetical protein
LSRAGLHNLRYLRPTDGNTLKLLKQHRIALLAYCKEHADDLAPTWRREAEPIQQDEFKSAQGKTISVPSRQWLIKQ